VKHSAGFSKFLGGGADLSVFSLPRRPHLKGIAVTELKGIPVTRQEFESYRRPFCLLCGRPTVSVGVYFPLPSSPIAPPDGRGMAVVYSLCGDCDRRRQTLYPLIEKLIERQVLEMSRAHIGN
jgi:hypothetical protein